ncbi:MAG TPA: 16S rRNA (cytosine(1402)-N(4))-methyltransferase RsmH [Clostridia bacterium]|nr:16S rRNA (cytosine(1402)-N(4))-methyltransferase RsmH [Clostridia bacterium]
MAFSHKPVLLNETIDSLGIKPEGIYIDGTAGGAGHSSEIAKRLTTGRLIAMDKDPDAIAVAKERLAPYSCATVVQNDFRNIAQVAHTLNIEKVDGVLLDLGVSSHQLDAAERGFSYQNDAPLDMRMSQDGMSAKDVVNTYAERDLARILSQYGEERFAFRIARALVSRREKAEIQTTLELADIIKFAIPAATRREGGHPAKRSFQAIRIEVNGELASLEYALDDAFELLALGGRLSVITFHSLEDRICKRRFVAFAEGCTCPVDFPVCVCGKTPRGRLVSKKPVTAGEEELLENNRSHSAKLRIIEKIKD